MANSESFENQNIFFRKNTGKETIVHIVREEQISSGGFGEIFDTLVEIDGHQKRFIVKKYYVDKKYNRKGFSKAYTEHAFENYSLAQKAGLKVFPTFRIGEDRESILMTTGFLGDQICIGSNNKKGVFNFEQSLIERIENLDEFLERIFVEGLKAAQRGILLYFDVFFFLLSKNQPKKIDFVLGDLDNLERGHCTKHDGRKNMEQIKSALNEFCDKNVSWDFREKFLEKVEFYFQQALARVGNSELK